MNQKARARALLIEMLSSGSALSHDVICREAATHGISRSTVQLAGRELGIVSTQGARGDNRRTTWAWEDPFADLM